MLHSSTPVCRTMDRRRLLTIIALAVLTTSAQSAYAGTPTRSNVALMVWGKPVQLDHGLATVDTTLYVAVPDIEKALGKESPFVGISSDSVVFRTREGGRRLAPYIMFGGEKYVALEAVAASVGGAGMLDRSRSAYLIQSRVEQIEWRDGECDLTLSHDAGKWRVGRLAKPPRIYVDIPDAAIESATRTIPVGSDGLARIRVGQCNPQTVRVVFDLVEPTQLALPALQSSKGVSLDVERTATGLRITPKIPVAIGTADTGSGKTEEVGTQAGGSTATGAVEPSHRTPGDQNVTEAVAGATSELGPPTDTVRVSGADFTVEPTGRRRVRILTSRSRGLAATARYLRRPSRISVDIPGSACSVADTDLPVADDMVREIRFGQHPEGARVVVELADDVYYRIFRDPDTDDLLIEIDGRPGAGGRLEEKRIVIDPGHGKKIIGARRKHWSRDVVLCEEDINLDVGRRLRDLLAGAGVPVFMTRDDDSNLGPTQVEDLQGRVDFAESNAADLFISIHCNSSSPNLDYSRQGTETYFCSPWSFWLADTIQTYLVNRLGTTDRGTKIAGFKVIRDTSMASVLVELAFINNPGDQDRLVDPEFRQKAAEAIFDALRAYVEGALPEADESTDHDSSGDGTDSDNEGPTKLPGPEERSE
jgi:N-acetylmuramoyl-L-alanine amidase